MSPTPSEQPPSEQFEQSEPAAPPARSSRSRRSSYHHGDLRNALVDAAVSLIVERGVRGFSLAEAGRRVGVSAAAPYRHFADREDLLAAVAVRALTAFGSMVVASAPASPAPSAQLAAIASAYVRFAAEQRALFESVFATEVDKSRHPEVHEAKAPIAAVISECVSLLCPGDPDSASALADALTATAHGYAVLLLDGDYGADADSSDPVGAVAAKAAFACTALIRGWSCPA